MELNRIGLATLLSMIIIVLAGFKSDRKIIGENAVFDILKELGEPLPNHFIGEQDADMIEKGKDLIHEGKTSGSRYISKHFVCTSCHNTVKESANIMDMDADSRLNYANENNIPYLQASTFFGMVNRETWYNDDYVKKYGDLVIKANKSLKESIQLCATVCSAGRALKEDEMQAILSYLWTLQLKVSDLDLSKDEIERIEKAAANENDKEGAIELIKSKYPLKSPATFVDAPKNLEEGYGLVGRPDMGSKIFELSCKKCHRPHGESDVVFEDSRKTFKWFEKNITKNNQKSIYNIIRYGTYSTRGRPQYMPHYTAEKMSNQQIEDLRAFMVQGAGNR